MLGRAAARRRRGARLAGRGDTRPTVLCYGHFDVQPPDPLELWESPPFELDERDGWLYARGIADDKGQLFMLLEAARRLAAAGELPVNVRFACDGEEETGGHSIVDFLAEDERGADAAVVFDSGMIEAGRARLQHRRARASATSTSRVRTGGRDLHSGIYGGAALNAMHALMQALSAVSCPRTAACPSRCGPGSRRRRPRRSRAGPRCRPARRSSPARARRPTDDARRRGVLPAHVGRALGRRPRPRRRLAAPAEDGAAGAGGGERLDPARARPDRRGDRAGLRAARPGGAPRRAPRSRSSCWSSSTRASSRRTRRRVSSRSTRSSRRSAPGPCSIRAGGTIPIVPALTARDPGDRDRLRAQRLEHPLAERAPARGLPPARRRDGGGGAPPPWPASASAGRFTCRSRRSSPTMRSNGSSATSGSTPRRLRLRDLPEHGQAARPLAAARRGAPRARRSQDVELTEHGYVFATLPARRRRRSSALIAHVDTSPDVSGSNVQPIVHRARRTARRSSSRAIRRRCSTPGGRRARRAGSATTSSRPTARRCSAPTTRRASPRSWPPSRISLRNPEPRARTVRVASRSTRRSARARGTSISSASAPTSAYTLDGSGLGELEIETFSADQVVSPSGAAASIRHGEGEARQRDQARRRPRRRAAEGHALAGDDRGPRGLRPPEPDPGRRRGGGVTFIVRDHDDGLLAEHVDFLRRSPTRSSCASPGRASRSTCRDLPQHAAA